MPAIEQMIQRESKPQTLMAGVRRLRHGIVNSYLVSGPEANTWVLVDAGLTRASASKIVHAAETRFGAGTRPTAIILTHGHFDHVGAVEVLARHWAVPVYAHPLEMPYLTGRSSYPPPDPTVGGGLMARLAYIYPRKPINLGNQVQPLPGDGEVPGLSGWRWLHTPGHSPGHISLFRMSDRTLIAGDAFVTVKQESLLAVLTQKPEVHGPPTYYTPNWPEARKSVEALAALEPEVAATGHGVPMSGQRLHFELQLLLQNFERDALPARGRYVHHPVITDERGVIFVPPPVPDHFPKLVGASLAALAVTFVILRMSRAPRKQSGQ